MELHDDTLTQKYIDDINISESISCSNVGLLQTTVDKVKNWSDKNNMKLNENKTKEMLISFKQKLAPVPPLMVNSNAVERAHSFKIFGVRLSDDLSWKSHVNHMYSRATLRSYLKIYFLNYHCIPICFNFSSWAAICFNKLINLFLVLNATLFVPLLMSLPTHKSSSHWPKSSEHSEHGLPSR